MIINQIIKDKIAKLKKEYTALAKDKQNLLDMIFEAEIPESVYNSNAIENSTLSIKETEKILLEMEVARNVSVREIFEAKNLARVFEYLKNKDLKVGFDAELILFLHKILLTNIGDKFAGRFREKGEYVRVGTYIAPNPEKVSYLIDELLDNYNSNDQDYFLEKISRFHLDFENIHPFCDGNGRIGRVLINYLLEQEGFPPIIIRNKEKKKYYQAFKDYRDGGNEKSQTMNEVIYLALLESLHKRLTYLKGEKIITVANYAKKNNIDFNNLLNKAKRQTAPAFREKGVWKISAEY